MANFINEIKVDGNNYPIAINTGCVSTAFTISDDNGELGLNLSNICLDDSGIKVNQNGSISVNYGEGLMMDGNKLKLFLGSNGPLKIDSCDGNSLSMNYGNGLDVDSYGNLGVNYGEGLTIFDEKLTFHAAPNGGLQFDDDGFKTVIHLGKRLDETNNANDTTRGIYFGGEYQKNTGATTVNNSFVIRFVDNSNNICETRISLTDSFGSDSKPMLQYRLGSNGSEFGDWLDLIDLKGISSGTTAIVEDHTLKL